MRNWGVFSFLLVATLTLDCSDVTFSARYTCIFHFTDTSDTCEFQSCDSQLISNPNTYDDWNTCYINCCPGIVTPLTQTRDNLLACANYFNSTPPLVIVIGCVIGFILCCLYILLPCCTTQFCPLYKLRQRLNDYCFSQQDEQHQSLNLNTKHITGQSSPKHIAGQSSPKHNAGQSNPSQHNLLASIDKILMQNQILEEQSAQQNQCRLCGQLKATIKFNCGHVFHRSCLKQKISDIIMCNFCQSKKIVPLLIYCSKCLRRYKVSSVADLDGNYLCKQCYIS